MKRLCTVLPILLLAARAFAAELAPLFDQASKYESGTPTEPLRQIERAVRESADNPAQRAEVEAGLVRMLAPTSTFEARRFACVQLSIMGTARSLAAVAELLKSPDTVGIACLALGSQADPKTGDVLRAALAASEGMARVQIIVTLGDRRDAAAVKPLGAAARGTDRASAEAAIGALGKIATPEALRELAALRQGGPPELAYPVAMASLVAAERSARSDASQATAIYSELLAAAQPVNVRRAALEGLLRLDADGGEQRILQVLRGNDPSLKPSAIVQVRRLKSPGASATFAREMAALTAPERIQMVESLAVRNDAAARSAITEQLLADDPEVRRAAAMAFAAIGDAAAVPALAQALARARSAPEQQVIEMVIASLKGGAAVDTQILALLRTGPAEPRAGLINALARRGSQASVPALLDLANTSDSVLARAAFRALGKLADATHLAALLDQLARLKAPAARGDAEEAAAKVIERTPDRALRSRAVITALAQAPDVETRCSLVSLLPVCGGMEALAAVNAVRADQDARLRETAFRALTAWSDETAIDPLLDLAQSGAPKTERVLALRGSIRLLGAAGEAPVRETVPRFQRAMAAARDLNEVKLVLGSLANLHDPIALSLVEPFLGDSALQAEAAQAIVTLAPYVCGPARDSVRAALQRVSGLAVEPQLKLSAGEFLETISQSGDFILAWQVAGPFTQEGKTGQELFGVVFPPEEPGAAQVKWQVMPAATLKPRPWQLDLGKLYGGDHRVAYARTWIHSDAEQPARLELGSDDGLKAWFNAAVVVDANRGGDVAPGTHKASVTLKPGWNPLVLKVTQWTAGWGFCARIAKPDGSPLPGVRADLNVR